MNDDHHLTFEDRKGDKNNVIYDSLYKYDIPKYNRIRSSPYYHIGYDGKLISTVEDTQKIDPTRSSHVRTRKN
jgi:hypothetical protein